MEAVVALILLILLGGLGVVLVLPIVALARTRQIGDLALRVQRLEAELARVSGRSAPTAPTPTPPPRPVDPEIPVLEVVPVAEESLPVAPSRPPGPAASVATVSDATLIENWIGQRGLGWAAVVLLFFSTAFFIKYAFDNDWIGPLGRVSIGLLAGVGLCLAGARYHTRDWRVFSQMLTAAGIVLIYLATFGAFAYYKLVGREAASVFLVILVAEMAALAVLYNAPSIALMAVIGGLLNPILLSTGLDQYRSFFMYLAVLNAGVVGLAVVRSWHAVGSVSLLGTQLLFWAWYHTHYHPEKLFAAVVFQTLLFALYFAYPLRRVATGPVVRLAGVEDLVRLVVNAFLYAVAGYVLLDADFHIWMGALALGMAILYTGRTWQGLRFASADERHNFVSLAVGLAFLAMVFPLQAHAAWIGVGWAALGLALWWFGLRIHTNFLRIFGTVLLFMAVTRLFFVDTPWNGRLPFTPIFNRYALPALTITGCVVAAAVVSRRMRRLDDPLERAVQVVCGLIGVVFVWLVLSVDAYQYFTAQVGRSRIDSATLHTLARVSLSVLWAVYAAVVLTAGFLLPSRPLRWAALALFGLTLAKVLLIDMAGLGGFYRVTAFFVLSLMMGGAAWGYQKIEALRRSAARAALESSEVPS